MNTFRHSMRPSSGHARRAGINALLLVLCVCVERRLSATDYLFNLTTGTGLWSTTTVWTPNGTPGSGDNIDSAITGSATLSLAGTTRTINNLTKTGAGTWTITGNSSSLSTLNVSSITDSTFNMNFTNGSNGGGLQVNAGDITLTGGSVQFGLGVTVSGPTNVLRGLAVSGTTTVSGSGVFRVSVSNTNNNTFSLGLLNVSGTATVSLNNSPSGKADSTGNVTGLNGSGGVIQTAGTTSTVGGQNGNASTLAITNVIDYTTSTVLSDGISATVGATLSLSKAGAGTQTLNGASTFTGATTITDGTLKLGNSSALGGRSGIVATNTDNGTKVSGTGTLDLGGQTVIEVIRLNGTGFGGNGALVNSGAAATITGGIAGITQTASGSTAPTLSFSGGGGSGVVASLSMGITTSTFTINGGTTIYSAAPTVTISGGGAIVNAVATANLTAGVVTSITISNIGAGYTSAPTITFSGGTVTTAGTNPTGTGNATNFTTVGYSVTSVGSGYTSAPTITFSNGTFAATAKVSGIVLEGDSSIGGSGAITISGIVSETGGSHALIKVGTNVLTLSNTGNSYTGATKINGGSISISADSNLGTAPGTATAGQLVIDGGTLTTTAGFTLNANRGMSLGTSGGQINTTTGTLTYGGIIAGTAGLQKSGTGTLLLSGTNAYSGATTISAGTLSIAADAALGTAPLTATAGQLVINGGTLTTTAGFVLDSNRGIDLGTTGGQISTTTGTLSYGGIMAGSGPLQKSGAGTLQFSGVNTYSGATTVSAGTLSIAADSALGTAPVTATAGQLTLNGGTLATTVDLTLNSNRGISLGSSGGTMDVAQDTTLTYGGIVAGTGTLTKTSAGTLNFTAANSYTGATAINAGTVSISNNTALGTSAGGVTVASGATLALSGDITVTGEALSLTGDGTASNVGALRNVSGDNTWTGNITIAAGATRINSDSGSLLISGSVTTVGSGNFNIGGNADIEVSGIISGPLTLFKSSVGTGTLILSNAGNTYTGITTIGAGTVKISTERNLGATPGSVVANSLRIRGGVLQTTATMSLSATRGVTLSNGGGGLNVDGGTTLTVNGVIAGANTDTLEKTGAGTLALTAANTYSGSSTITGGAVYVNNTSGSGLGTGDVSVSAVAALGGSGSVILGTDRSITVNGSLIVGNSGDIAGSSLALATSGTGSTNLSGTSTLHLDIFSGAGLGDNTGNLFAADILDLSGNLTITLGAILKLENPNGISSGSWADGDTFKLFDWSGLISRTGTFTIDASDLNLPSGFTVNTADLYTLGNISFMAVPEPGRALLMAVALGCVLWRRRRAGGF